MKFTARKSDNQATAPLRRLSASGEGEAVRQRELYRRNKTITGSTSRYVASSNENAAQMQSPRALVHHLHRRRRKLWGLLLATGLGAFGLMFLLSQLMATYYIHPVARASLSDERTAVYQQTLNDYFQPRPLERLKLLLNQQNLRRYVSQQHPEIAQIVMTPTGINGRADVLIIPRQPVAKWQTNDQTEFVDTNGVIFTVNAYRSPGIAIKDTNRIGTSSGIVASHRFLEFVGRVAGAAKREGIAMKSASIPLLKTRQLDVQFREFKYPVKFSIERKVGEQLEDAVRVARYLARKGISPRYIDVRVPGEAYYR